MCLSTIECTSIGLHWHGLFRTNKRTPYGWSWMPCLCIPISVHTKSVSQMVCRIRIVIPVHRICHQRHTSVTPVSLSLRGIESPSLHLGTFATVGCARVLPGHLHRCLQGSPVQWQWIIFGLCPYVVTGWISSHVLYHGGGYRLTVEYHTTVSLPDGCTGVTVSRPTAVALPISHRGRLERKSRRKRGDPAHSSWRDKTIAIGDHHMLNCSLEQIRSIRYLFN